MPLVLAYSFVEVGPDCEYESNAAKLLLRAPCLLSLIGAFYFTLGNLLPQHRSQLHNTYLVALAKSKYIKKYGINEMCTQEEFTVKVSPYNIVEFML